MYSVQLSRLTMVCCIAEKLDRELNLLIRDSIAKSIFCCDVITTFDPSIYCTLRVDTKIQIELLYMTPEASARGPHPHV